MMPKPGIIDRAALISYKGIWQAVDLLFPTACIQCGKPSERWCPDCRKMVERLGVKVCKSCGKRLAKGKLCQDCRAHPPHYMALRSYGLYRDPLRKAILRLKYHRDLGLGEILSDMLYQLVSEQDWQIDLVIPVPISPSRLQERGYNQVDLFARPLAWQLGLPCRDHVLTRIHEDISQVELTADNRRMNVARAFQVEWAHPLRGRNVLLVDDVATTCSTADACAERLISAGASQVYVASLARSLLRRENPEVI